ncbi:hypothetical protein OG792_14660 [Micromonospora sp. NBC_01699]|uniref:hypothetical protein n=1 Tax=Micromonospora sp. NBC_01699 TaxID=2975984 RepID=UPI002E2F3072|nr:hypothetical protein [Micromonospora sp. NBC_01699]
MVTWIVLAVVLFALFVLVLAARPVLVRLPGLERAALALLRRQGQVEALASRAETLQERLLVLQRQAEVTRQRLILIKAKHGE